MAGRRVCGWAVLWAAVLAATMPAVVIVPAQTPQPGAQSAAPPAPAATPQGSAPAPAPKPALQNGALPETAGVAVPEVHDPSMIKAGNTWYVFSSGGRRDGSQLPVHCSTDLLTWAPCGHVFDAIPPWIPARLPAVGELWAPDISFEDGEYRLYYCYSVLGKSSSGIALVTNKTLDRTRPDYAWVDHGPVVETREGDDYNAIDPNFFRDGEGGDWLIFGSFWSGIKLHRLGPDGMLSPGDRKLYSLARRTPPLFTAWPPPGTSVPWQAIEAGFLVHHEGFYYLFTSWDHCCQGSDSNYHVVVGRAATVTGPYRDESGHKLMDGGGTTILAGDAHWAGPGGQSLWMGPGDNDVLVYHAYDRQDGGRVALRLAPLRWQNGWPVVAGGP